MLQGRSVLHLGEGLLLGGSGGVPGQRAPWRSAVHSSRFQRGRNERSTESRQPLQRPCSLDHALSQLLSANDGSILEKESPEASESCKEEGQNCPPCSALQGALPSVCCWGRALSVPRRTLGRIPRTWGLSSPPPSPLLHSLQAVTQRFSHLSTRPGPDAKPPSWGRGRSSKQACLYLI